MAEDTVSLGLLTAVFNDELRGKKMAELLELLGRIEVTKSEALAAQQAAEQALLDADRKHGEARALVDKAAAHEADLVERERGLEKAITGLNAQNEAFGKVRTAADADHREREGKLRGVEEKHRKKASDLADREEKVAKRERDASAKETDLAAREGRLGDIVAQLSAPKAA